MQYQIIPAPPSLDKYVRYFWTAEVNPSSIHQYQLKTLVDDSSGIIFQQRVNGSAIRKNGDLIPGAFLYGQTTKPTLNECLSEFACVGVLFHPHAAHELFKFDSSFLTDYMLEWEDVGAMPTLSDNILNAADTTEGLNLIISGLQRLVSTKQAKTLLSKTVVDYIRHHKGLIRVRDIHDHFRISERRLERIFQSEIGVTPRHFIQVTRFQEIVQRFRSDSNDRLIDIAYDLNFFDQSHFNNLIRKFSDCTPGKLRDSLKPNVVNVFLYNER